MVGISMGHMALFLALVLGAVLLGGISVAVGRIRARRRLRALMLERCFGELRSALEDPVLIHQAQRRIRSSRPD
jgi:hypothetical protein